MSDPQPGQQESTYTAICPWCDRKASTDGIYRLECLGRQIQHNQGCSACHKASKDWHEDQDRKASEVWYPAWFVEEFST